MKEMERSSTKEAEAYMPFVRRIAGRMARRLPQSVELDDLMAAGTIGLMEALDRFDPQGGRSFETYAEFRVKGAILDELRRNDPLNRSTRTAQTRMAHTTAQLTAEYGRPPSTEELATALNISVENFMTKFSPLETYRVVPIDPDTMPLAQEQLSQEEELSFKETVRVVRQGLEKLTSKQQLVLSLYYVEELNQAQIGQIIGVSESRVCQILNEATKLVRKQIKRVME